MQRLSQVERGLSDFEEGWLCGFIEGEGSFITGGINRPYFSLAQKNVEILRHIQTMLGFGTVQPLRYLHLPGYGRYGAYSKSDTYTIANLLLGRLKLKRKQMQFSRWLNAMLKCHWPVPTDPKPVTKEFNEGWIVGFSEAEGMFWNNKDGRPIFRITQVRHRYIFEWIRKFLGFGYVNIHWRKNHSWHYIVSNPNDRSKIAAFFKGRLKHPDVIASFNLWVQTFENDHPIRVKGRAYTRDRYSIRHADPIWRANINAYLREWRKRKQSDPIWVEHRRVEHRRAYERWRERKQLKLYR